MVTPVNILALVLAYLIGSVASAVWIGQVFYNLDVREYGSGNSGATNAFRVLGKKAGIAVLLIDSSKGWLSVNLANAMHSLGFLYIIPGSPPFIDLQLALGIAALLGHIFPVYVGFRGGKGIATLLGIILAVHLHAALASMSVFIAVLLVSRYVSLSSMAAATAFPIFLLLIFEVTNPALVIFSLIIAILVLITHQKNIERLMNKEENKANLFGKPES